MKCGSVVKGPSIFLRILKHTTLVIDKSKLQSVWVNEICPRVWLFPTYSAMSICLALRLSDTKLSVNIEYKLNQRKKSL